MIDDLRILVNEKLCLKMKPKFISSREKHRVYFKSNDSNIMTGNDTDEVIQEIFDLFLQKYQIFLEQPIKGSDFNFHYFSGMYHICNKISINYNGYINFPKWTKRGIAATNLKSNDGNCFQYVITVGLNHVRIKTNLLIITNNLPLNRPV